MHKKFLSIFIAVLSLFLMTGCSFTANVEDLYRLPRLPSEYEKLEQKLTDILNGGAETIAPLYGENLQSVQRVDLNGDGNQEVVAFFYRSSDDRPLKAYIFQRTADSYEQIALLEGSGSSIYSIQYEDINRDGNAEILVGWRSADANTLSVYSMVNMKQQLLMETPFSRFQITDMDSNEEKELFVLRNDSEAEGTVADYYSWTEESLKKIDSCYVSIPVSELNRIVYGTFSDGSPALFITGIRQWSILSCDILSLHEGKIQNLTLNNATGTSTLQVGYSGLPVMDVNGDGITEVPSVRKCSREVSQTVVWEYELIDWMQYDTSGTGRRIMTAYSEKDAGWYLDIPEDLQDKVVIHKTDYTSGESTISYTVSQPNGAWKEVLQIIILTGEGRENRGKTAGRKILLNTSTATYAYFLTSEGSKYYTDLSQSFHIMNQSWTDDLP